MDDFAKQLQEQEKALENIRHKLALPRTSPAVT